MHRGWVSIYRSLSSSDLWLSEPFTRGQAWVDLILITNRKDGFIRARGIKIEIKRGQCGWSEVALKERWQWSRGKVRRFLKELETVQQIVQQKTNVTTLINIVNYDRYQLNSTPNGTASGTADGHQTVQQTDTRRDTNNKGNTGIQEIIPPIPPKGDELYNFYISEICPQQKSKTRATGNIKSHLKKYDYEDLVSAIRNYKTISKERDPQYRKDPANFFAKREPCFKDYLPGTFKPASNGNSSNFIDTPSTTLTKETLQELIS